MATRTTTVQFPKKLTVDPTSDLINTLGATFVDQNFLGFRIAAAGFNFSTPKMVSDIVKTRLRQIFSFPNPQGTILCRVWKNATGSNFEIVETAVETVDVRFLPVQPTWGDFTFTFLGIGGFFTNPNVAIGLEYINQLDPAFVQRQLNTTNVTPTGFFKYVSTSDNLWVDDTANDLIAQIQVVTPSTFPDGIAIISKRANNVAIVKRTANVEFES